jgi:flagellar basal-body rod protein FlgB
VEFGPALAEALQFSGTNAAVGGVMPVVKTDTASAMRLDGNNVDIDREATYLAQTQLQFSALMAVVTKNLTTMSSIITGAR